MRRVALFSTNFLEYSQTFVHEEIIHHERYEVEVFCRQRHLPERFPFEPTHVGTPGLYSLTRHCPKFHRVFQQRPFDLVHAHFGTGACYAYPYSHRYDLPLVVTFHGYDVPLLASTERLLPTNWPYALAAPTMLEHLTLGLCASHELFELLLEVGVPRERLRLYHLGVDLGAFKRGPRRAVPRVVMVGRFIEKKGFEYGVRGFADALARGAVGELTIIGTGEREAKLRALVAELGIGHAVTFAGVLTSQDVASFLSESDVLMAPSVVAIDGNRESGVIALKEGSACGLAVLGTYHGGIPEIIEDGVTGYLVPERDVASLGDRLHRLLTDRALCAQLGENGRVKIAREYNLPDQVAELESLYDEAVALGPVR
ncbi:MAG TPA: glycosyltransferase [Polyangiales bacterium]|nr:glycosyltransferase [Polyangiales bacterium]